MSQQHPYGQVPDPAPGWYPAGGDLRWWDGRQWTEHVQPDPSYDSYASAPGRTVVVTDARVSVAEVTVAWVVAVVTGLYMLPWAVAATRGTSNSGSVAIVNLLLGWTVIGWIVALVMACRPHRVTVLQV